MNNSFLIGDWSLSCKKQKVNMDRLAKRLLRLQKKVEAKSNQSNGAAVDQPGKSGVGSSDKYSKLLAENEDVVLNFVANINNIYQDKLGRPAPFVSFVICGMQSSGKSTIMERFLNAPLNIVQEGTGTRCPLDTTCIHDKSLTEPVCELRGTELDSSLAGEDLSTEQVFAAITEHNQGLAHQDRFSTETLRLTYRANNVQNMRFVDTPGIIANQVKTRILYSCNLTSLCAFTDWLMFIISFRAPVKTIVMLSSLSSVK